MFEQEIVKLGGTKLLGGTLLSIGGVSALAIGGVIAWKVFSTSKSSKSTTPEPKHEDAEAQQCTGDESAQALHSDLQAEIDALQAEKQKLSEQVDDLKTQSTPDIVPPVVEKHHDESFPKTNLKLGMLQQLIRENLDFRNATTS
ncbi:hypothetical protein [Candidatus Albibeggiatoa sp. nov. NOAA]|uniref:hypothetical protein n=1 Tax=Candidatus Albibeggiatoa sp. nov. NOAA TaxID=3162724 RepID=UPI003304BD5B|nr:hypothetical protein [Thiotrichaceae bacterium]